MGGWVGGWVCVCVCVCVIRFLENFHNIFRIMILVI